MPILHGHTRNRATMYGLAQHARAYDRHAGLLGRPLYRRVARDVASAALPAGSVVLDVGTGPGRVPRLIATACPRLTVEGVDLSAAMIAHATAATAGTAGADRIRFRVADVTALPFEDASVDLVVSSISLHHWDDPAAGLRDIVRVLRPGAQAWIYDFRTALRHPEAITGTLDADIRLENPAAGSFRFSPISRLVLRRH
jgi:ubiquinone/menaquinone biosynthesis C-methylase UbiE